MDRYEVGMLARSKAGHDKGHVYIIMKEEAAYVYLVDGSLRPIEKPKKKKKKQEQKRSSVPETVISYCFTKL